MWETSIGKQCAICSKNFEAWDDYESNHIVSWQKGDRTSIDNGKVSHISRNRRKGGKKFNGTFRVFAIVRRRLTMDENII
ncbi:HNH endonuclease [Pseudomonas sp. TH03]|nr:HNH endonuclease [Pseudomonas sp. TH03]